ncbi:FtsQ-type POTRA domain-containing protein [Microbacterium sp. cx-59]|uniref:FtsQ-type POTRA domain-containing protein n=1 Tax=Microbacterium sp. cx-59 TaxID=2891207 RepID=UPI001E61A74B|nr:FtsQ-type POTRA domain-containing protein [Microbacterium sp. cx-59]MCC4907607.1 FtsQ-type POTRA domain-containing protein [Microbacterium sp. cx-59]
MRRPSPLPPPAGASSSGGRDDSARRSVERRTAAETARGDARVDSPDADELFGAAGAAESDSDVGAGAGDDAGLDGDAQITAPIAPLVLPRTTPGASPVDPGTGRAAGAPTEAEPVGIRDVWRAARARRRALRAEVRRFTVRQRRRRMLWLGVAASLVIVTVATVGAAYSPLFAVEQVEVVGTQQLAAADVQEALSGQIGTPLAAIDESAIKSALVQFPLVESYTVEARPPHELIVRIVERTPVGVFSSASGYTLVDAAGVALSTTPDAPAGYAIMDVSGGVGSPAFAAAGRVMRTLPADLRAQVTVVTASTPDDVTLTLGAANAKVVWGSADDSAQKARVLQALMVARPADTVSEYDVSSPEAGVVR